MSERHEEWMHLYGRTNKDLAEKERRFNIFKDNVVIESVNRAGNRPNMLSINQFADQTNEEFKASRNGYKMTSRPQSSEVTSFRYENTVTVPSSMNWRKKGAVAPVNDQGQCGCCWAFSAGAAMEGITQLKTGKLIPLSEQELVDGHTSGEEQGCEGGLMDIIGNGGLTTEANYPYRGADGKYNKGKSGSNAAKIKNYEDVPGNSEAALLKAVAQHPVSVAINAGGPDFQFYSSGVFSGQCGTDLDQGAIQNSRE